jgi:hypothetical protein
MSVYFSARATLFFPNGMPQKKQMQMFLSETTTGKLILQLRKWVQVHTNPFHHYFLSKEGIHNNEIATTVSSGSRKNES